jgi:glyoxylase-like metal-dependent hydrolase (beta-lactamase superfamily II)
MEDYKKIKTVRTASRYDESVFSIREHYESEMRKYNKTRKIYDVDQYAEVYQYRDNLFCILTESLDGMGNPWSYLIIGPERAMLIDTSFGLGDLKGLADRITGGKPLIIVNTHSHFDHAYGNFQFDRVYCHYNEEPLLREKMNPHIWDYLYDENGKGRWADFDRKDMIPYRAYEIVGVPDNYEFDLGNGYIIELMYLPGHTPGHSVFLDHSNHVLFGGDHICIGGGLMLGNIKGFPELQKQMKKIIDRSDEIETVFPGHGPVDISKKIIFPIYETICKIMQNPECYESSAEFSMDGNSHKIYVKNFFGDNTINYSI